MDKLKNGRKPPPWESEIKKEKTIDVFRLYRDLYEIGKKCQLLMDTNETLREKYMKDMKEMVDKYNQIASVYRAIRKEYIRVKSQLNQIEKEKYLIDRGCEINGYEPLGYTPEDYEEVMEHYFRREQ